MNLTDRVASRRQFLKQQPREAAKIALKAAAAYEVATHLPFPTVNFVSGALEAPIQPEPVDQEALSRLRENFAFSAQPRSLQREAPRKTTENPSSGGVHKYGKENEFMDPHIQFSSVYLVPPDRERQMFKNWDNTLIEVPRTITTRWNELLRWMKITAEQRFLVKGGKKYLEPISKPY